MARFAVEIRASRGASNDKPIKGYLGLMNDPSQRDEDDEPVEVFGVRSVETIKNTDYIPYFDTARAARRAVADMPDGFHDIYETAIVEIVS